MIVSVSPPGSLRRLWQYGLSSFQRRDTKLNWFSARNRITEWKITESKIETVLQNQYFHTKDSYGFWYKKLALKVGFCHFLTTQHYIYWQNTIIFFEYLCWFLVKHISNKLCILFLKTWQPILLLRRPRVEWPCFCG